MSRSISANGGPTLTKCNLSQLRTRKSQRRMMHAVDRHAPKDIMIRHMQICKDPHKPNA